MSRRPIPGWPGYHVDDEGRVYSTLARVHISGLTWKVLAGQKAPTEVAQFDRKDVRKKATPYLSVCLSRDGDRRNFYVHELVALTFLGPRPDGAEILHGERGSRCNALSNLRYGTPEENSAERVLSRGAAWYRARGIRPPDLAPIEAPAELEHAFSDLIG